MDKSKLWIITAISNPVRYKSRYDLYGKFERQVLALTPNFVTAELAYGRRDFEVTDSSNPKHIQLRTKDEIWHKENLLNLALMRLPEDWEYVAWVDADVAFQRPDWIEETLEQLQHHQIVQMWESAVDLGPSGQVIQTHASFGKCFKTMSSISPLWRAGYDYPHPGFAWAARREAIEAVGGLMDQPILGSADHHMAWCTIGRGLETLHPGVTAGYRRMIDTWQARAERTIKRDIGFVPGTVLHSWHGKKKDRNYTGRWDIILSNNYDPDRDIVRATNGVYRLDVDGSPRLLRLRDQIRLYFRQRNEDSIDLE